MKLLGKIICHGVRYYQYADDTQLYISAYGELNNVITILSQCPEGRSPIEVWVGSNRLKLNWQDRAALENCHF